MKSEYADCEVEDAPVSPLLAEGRQNRYGPVSGLDEEELASPEELERAVFLQEWGPVLALPVRGRKSWIQPGVDEDGGLDFGAFATVDFERGMSEFDKARYKADKLQEELRDVLIMVSTVSARLPRAKYQVLKLLRDGIIELEHIENFDMWQMARLYLRARKLQNEIKQLRDASWARRRRELAEVLR